ncbi:MAG: hypothetical protein Q8880_12620, partial [Bacteroidota bacterium]|nr:hypothetical protein [Bacteroidota bacterium]
IIDKGFEAHHFITGLSEHIRNLLVCKDPETIKLLEVGANIRDKYKEQSSNCTYQMLLKALDISSKCDLQYKNVTNKRIHLELSMLQMCYINNGLNNIIQAEEAPKVPAAQNNPAVQNQMPPKVSASVPVNNPLPPSAAPKPATIVNQTSAQPPVRQASFNSAPQKSVSISGFIKSNPTQKEQENLPKPDKLTTAFTAEMLEQRWKEYAESISQDSPSFSSTLLNSKPQLKGNFNIGVCVENLVQQDEFNEKKVDLLGYLKEKLKNTEITITAEVKHVEVTERLYNPKDKFNKLAEKNPNVNDLRNKLELDYEY